MKDDAAAVSPLANGDGPHNAQSRDSARQSSRTPSPLQAKEVNESATDRNATAAMDKSDSEAETVVLPGKEEVAQDAKRQAIKHETNGAVEPAEESEVASPPKDTQGKHHEYHSRDSSRASLKRKRDSEQAPVDGHEAGNSSNLSSTPSSPGMEARSTKKSGSEFEKSRSTTPNTEASRHNERGHDERERRRRGKSDPTFEPQHVTKRRDTRSATHDDNFRNRSHSPPPPSRSRTQSSQTGTRRKAPPPLHVDRRVKLSEDLHGDSDDSSSVQSHPRLQKVTSVVDNAMSPAKISHKKLRDKNGRTPLARACAAEDLEEAKQRLRERPQDLDVSDNAGNTPLQIASLGGLDEIVQMLIEAGCDIHCKNLDQDTPLIDAVENSHLDVVKLLLKAGADPNVSKPQGDEPLDLVDMEDENGTELREAIMAAKEQASIRRHSVDAHRNNSTDKRDNDQPMTGRSAGSPTDSIPIQSTKSPPPGAGSRRRAARSQPTRDDLLWTNPTPENLRDAVRKGDLTKVDHILKMRDKVDSETMVAAARGGNQMVLELLTAIGNSDPDPEPLDSTDYRQGYNTPMLAAIGRGNIDVIRVLLAQRGFDPTRRVYKNLPYYEIASERKGVDWEEEVKILKEAFENHKNAGGRRSNHNSPRKVRSKPPDNYRSLPDHPSTSIKMKKERDRRSPTASSFDSKAQIRDGVKSEKRSRISDPDVKESSAAVSDRDLEALGPPKSKVQRVRSSSDAGAKGDESRRKRKLLSRNDISDQDLKRRASVVEPSLSSPDSGQRKSSISSANKDPVRKSSNPTADKLKFRKESVSTEKVKLRGEGHVTEKLKVRKESATEGPHLKNTEEPSTKSIDGGLSKGESGKKRLRLSSSPSANRQEAKTGSEVVKKKKRRRVDSQGNAVEHDSERHMQPGNVRVANMTGATETPSLPNNPPGAAPVAFMGGPISSPVKMSSQNSPIRPTSSQDSSSMKSPEVHPLPEPTPSKAPSPDQTAEQKRYQEELERQGRAEAEAAEKQKALEAEEQKRAEAEQQRITQEEAEKQRAAKEEADRLERIAREQEEIRLAEQRLAEEAQRKLQLERDEEEAREARRRREEEAQRQRVEQERLRKQEQERRRVEAEERERLRLIQIQEEEERQRLDALPHGLRHAAELSPEESRSAREVLKWLPLRTLYTRELSHSCADKVAQDRWVPNIQAALILGSKDYALPQCKLPLYILSP